MTENVQMKGTLLFKPAVVTAVCWKSTSINQPKVSGKSQLLWTEWNKT